MGRTKTTYKRRDQERREIAYRIRHSRDAQEAEDVAQFWQQREELLEHKGKNSPKQAEIMSTSSIPTQPAASTSTAPPHTQHDFDCDPGSGGLDFDMNEVFPQAVIHLHKQPNGGMPIPSLDDELIQRNETRFFDIHIDAALPFIVKAQEDRKRFDRTGGLKPLTAGRAFHLNAIEKEGLREARKAREMAQTIEEGVIDEIKHLMLNPPVPEEPQYESEDASETGYNDCDSNSEDSENGSYADSGEDEVIDSDWWGADGDPTGKTGLQNKPNHQIRADEDLWEDQIVDADFILQDALYFDIVMNPSVDPPTNPPANPPANPPTNPPTNPLTNPHAPLPFPLPLFTQTDASVEVDTGRGNKHPSGMINRLEENVHDPFPVVLPSKPQSTRQPVKDEDMRCTIFMINLLISACFSYFKASHRLMAMLLKGFGLILKRLGHLMIAEQLPKCVDSIYTCLEISTTPFLVLPICLKCNDVYPHDPTGDAICLRCDLGLYPPDSMAPEPRPQRQVRVPTYKLTLLLLSAQIEAFLNVEGVEVDIDRWRRTGPTKGIYTDVTKARVWNEIVDHEGKLFFRTEQINNQRTGPANEIRLGVHMAIDWYVIHFHFTC